PDIKDIPNSRLFTLLDEEDSRQMLHITYGVLLMETDSFGNSIFKERLYKALHKFEEDYYSLLNAHLLKHFEALGLL
ncbi:MAG TPA: tagaturonate epimerase family protein, partial [Clostridia bacterium]|nr:tagaturonate epimerase family protein [Clostridia bacterium]